MSRIYFHSIDKTVEVGGPERAHFGVFCANLTWAMIEAYVHHDSNSRPSPIRKIVPASSYLNSPQVTGAYFEKSAETFFKVSQDKIKIGEKESEIFSINLNTAYRMGSDPVKLAARIHGQCEIHCYVEGKNRKWLSGIVQQGIDIGFYRAGMGWDDVVKLLLLSDKSPVVLSYSVCEQFPNAPIDYQYDREKFYDLQAKTQWARAMKSLRARGGWLELKPDNWSDYYFRDGIDANDVAAYLATL